MQLDVSSLVLSKSKPISLGFPGGTSGKECSCQCKRHKGGKFYPWSWEEPPEGEHGNILQREFIA